MRESPPLRSLDVDDASPDQSLQVLPFGRESVGSQFDIRPSQLVTEAVASKFGRFEDVPAPNVGVYPVALHREAKPFSGVAASVHLQQQGNPREETLGVVCPVDPELVRVHHAPVRR